jgi:hypothetical protein
MLGKLSTHPLLSNSRNITILFIVSLLLALTLRIKFEVNYPQVYGDYANLALKTKNFIEGHGFTYGRVSLKDLSQVNYETWNLWPNGFSIMLVPLYYLTGSLITSMVLAQVIGVILLLFGFLRIFKILELSKLTQSIFLLFAAFTATPYSYLGTTDLLTAGLFLWVIALTIEICTKKGRSSWKEITIGVLLFFSAALRYACISNIIIIPCLFIFLSLLKKERRTFFTGILILVYAAIPTFIFFAIYKMIPGRSYLADALTHFNFSYILHYPFYWSSLKWFDAFPLKAFFFTLPLEFRLPINHFIIKSVRLTEYLFSLLILGYLLWCFLKKRSWLSGLKENKPIDIFTLLGMFSLIVIVGTISLQSLTMPLEQFHIPWMPEGMTAVFITRYFVIGILVIQVFFFLLMDGLLKKVISIKYAHIFVLGLFVSSMLINFQHWGYSTYKCYVGKDSYSYWDEGNDMISMYKILNLDAQKNPGINIVIATYKEARDVSDPSIYAQATNFIYQYDSIIGGKFQHTKPVILYTVMPKTTLTEQEKKFVADFNPQQVLQCSDGIVYRTYLQ